MRERTVLFTLKVRWMDGDGVVPFCRISFLRLDQGLPGHKDSGLGTIRMSLNKLELINSESFHFYFK